MRAIDATVHFWKWQTVAPSNPKWPLDARGFYTDYLHSITGVNIIIRGNKKDALLDAAIKSYAEYGEQGLTTKNLARVADCSEALIYRHFKSKDDLLRACYIRLHNKAVAAFEPVEYPENTSLSDVLEISKRYWLKVFRFFVDAGYESLFYFWFRMSDVFAELLKEGSEDITKAYTSSFMNMFEEMRVRFNLDISAEHYRTYIVYFTGTFVSQVVTGKLPNTEESFDMIANLIFGGLITTVPGISLEKLASVDSSFGGR